ncbi:MAG: hypothetical protein E3J52_07670 [Promethearchaeota archaeon]|nr:MAG: hypothetical protein E3J52_07670 [Candidatus Lokiarchaeota archaeon]
MENIIKEIKKICNNKKLTFCDTFYYAEDHKTIMGEIFLKEILFLDYRDSEAGSNPREYNGLKKTNLEIFKSLLAHQEMFRFLHSGIIVSLTDTAINNNSIKYSDSCLTNGNQTRFIMLIIALLKLFFNGNKLKDVVRKECDDFLRINFGDDPKIMPIIKQIKFAMINQVVNYLKANGKYLKIFNNLKLDQFLNLKIRIQVNLIDSIVNDLEDNKIDEYTVGTLIAEANNDTQKVKVDDIFGNKYKNELKKYIFKDFSEEFTNKVMIEYRMGEIVDKIDKVHILTLLRPIVPLGLLTKEKNIFKYTNQRAPIYKLFERILRVKEKKKNTIETISKLIPLLYEIRIKYVVPQLDLLKKQFTREYTGKAINGELENTIIHKEISSAKGNEQLLEKIVRKNVGYNIEHIFPVFVYRIRKLFRYSEAQEKIELTISNNDVPIFFKTLIEVIYKRYIEVKLKGLPTSLTTVVRSSEFYEKGEEAYITLKNTYSSEETDFIEKNKYIIR